MGKSPIVARINAILASKHISKKEFYDAVGITSASYSNWNTGKTKPRITTLAEIARFLDVPLASIVQTEEKEKPATNDELSVYKNMVLQQIDEMTPAEIALLFEKAKQIIDLRE